MVVRRCVSGKRLMRWMPERPAVTAFQLSARPTPSEVTTPMPVTATTGRPRWARSASAMIETPPFGSVERLDEAHAFAAPDAPRRHDDPLGSRGEGSFETGLIARLV